MCNRLDEDGGHLLLKCKEVKQVWRELNLESVRSRLIEAVSPMQMMERVMELEEKKKLTVITLLWLWWGELNSFRGGVQRLATEVALSLHFKLINSRQRKFHH